MERQLKFVIHNSTGFDMFLKKSPQVKISLYYMNSNEIICLMSFMYDFCLYLTNILTLRTGLSNLSHCG